ncbi:MULTISPECIES: hypothetical protein [Bradyrhizobium]|uniref:Uncharacterized protein n=1 Tax=Bradyrhizobium septentrionale TaxID=1404411 RepID=A0A973VWU8_9BRAD|nr:MULTISPECIES: hypothetical protein [Bradyrhizobium]MCK7667903.1 hypothetical protein [Bradyrhizobium sp. 2S1]QIG97934.1 hypothetical protein G6P99_40685 [Bradyrhizobium sp. 6(2017)]UGY12389.1 hypothetical protein HAP48_0027470 [Bradyrhizobium septentrionale]UGY25499.1 hypothetical protein HU675_0000710 [Bradyrhizobium septentrionale]
MEKTGPTLPLRKVPVVFCCGLTLLNASVRAIADAASILILLTSVTMADQAKLPIVEQAEPHQDTPTVSRAEQPADRHWFLDKLEDDEVREALKGSAALAPCHTETGWGGA